MPSTFRIPQADLDTLRGRLVAAYSRRTYGQVVDSIYVGLHHPQPRTAESARSDARRPPSRQVPTRRRGGGSSS